MTLKKISLMESYIIETLRNSGVTNDELLQVNNASILKWSKAHENFDMTLLEALAKNEAAYPSIIEDGYTIKFLTFNGLINMLRLKFDKTPNKDFEKLEDRVVKLHIQDDERVVLEEMLSPNWTIVSADDGTISIQSPVQ